MTATRTTVDNANTEIITLSDEQRADFVRSVKIGYFREFYQQGLITSEQLAMLIRMQDKSENSVTA